VRYSMTANDAVELCRLVRPPTAIPIGVAVDVSG